MTTTLNTFRAIADNIVQTGRDGNALQFDVASFTKRRGNDGKVIHYELVLDMDRLECRCSCPGCVCHRLVWYFHVPTSRGCCHIEAMRRFVVPILRAAGVC